MHAIHTHQDADLSREQARAIVSLLNGIWPSTDKTVDELVEAFLEAAQTPHPEAQSDTSAAPLRFVIWDGDRAIAHAHTYKRTIFTAGESIGVMALSGVCVAPAHRGKGLGAALSRKAFTQVDRGDFPMSLFQTEVPAFYEKLGARLVDNPFVNSKNTQDPTASPWHDAHVMIYPAPYSWPGGVIDLNGPGY